MQCYQNHMHIPKLVQPLWKIVWHILTKLKIELPYDPANTLLSIYLDKTTIQKKKKTTKQTCTAIFIAELFTIAKIWKQPKCPLTDEWKKKMEYYSVIKRECNNAICSNMDRPGDDHAN